MHFKVAVRIFNALHMQAGDSLTDVLRVVSVLIDKQLPLRLPYAISL